MLKSLIAGGRTIVMRAQRAQNASAGAWLLVAFCAALLFVLAIVLDWVNLRPPGYQLAGSGDPVRRMQVNPTYPPQQIQK
jgi:hypothetical protein